MRPTQEYLDAYRHALTAFVHQGDERGRQQAYDLGRRALHAGVGLFELVVHHGEMLGTVLTQDPAPVAARRAMTFFSEAAASFEMALRGYREANDGLRRLTETLSAQVQLRTEELARAERRYRELVEQLPAVTFVAPLGPEAPMLFVSPQIAGLAGVSPEDWLREPWLGRVHVDDRERVEDSWRHAQRGQTAHVEFRIVRPDERVVWVREEAKLLEVVPVVRQGIWVDVTETRRLEQHLQRAQKSEAIGRLAAGVAHDFNNVLTAIICFANFALEELPAAHPGRESVGEVVAAAERAAALVRQLMSFARRSASAPTVLDVDELTARLEQMLRRLVGGDIELVRTPSSGQAVVQADPSQVEQVVVNLVVNARDAMPAGGRLSVEIRNVEIDAERAVGRLEARAGPYVMIAVSDTGTGMAPEVLGSIFEPFFTTKPEGRGTGLGLAVVRDIVRQHGGDISVESTLGAGTTFRVFLPRATGEGGVEPSPAPRPEVRAGHERILVVDDEPSVRAAAVRALTELGYRVVQAGTPEEALALCADPAEAIDLVVADVVMPGSSGPQLIDALRAHRPQLHVLFMSCFSGAALQHRGILDKGVSYMAKPFTPELLAARVREALNGP